DINSIINAATKIMPRLLIIDSIQTMMIDEANSLPGTPTSVRACTAELINFAKTKNVPVIIIGQMTKDGSVAGPKTLEHLVDTVMTVEGDNQSAYRMLRCGKNRFGSTDEVGIFEMLETGMQAVENPSMKFLEERSKAPGSAITCVMEGTRPILLEIQALAEKSFYANPVRRTSGFDNARLQMLLAIISKRAGINISGHDVYVNVVGGIKTKDHGVDAAVCAAIMSSVLDKTIPEDTIVIGELGLGGEIRSVQFLDRKQKEAQRLGMHKSWSPKTIKNIQDIKKALS
ncbi:DNA repair protein RadA, partial [Patescibacteria group bacterium]|nr:DNA repair protein RadA [Patescibacteria group bacterium]